jgi:hypothetical protein
MSDSLARFKWFEIASHNCFDDRAFQVLERWLDVRAVLGSTLASQFSERKWTPAIWTGCSQTDGRSPSAYGCARVPRLARGTRNFLFPDSSFTLQRRRPTFPSWQYRSFIRDNSFGRDVFDGQFTCQQLQGTPHGQRFQARSRASTRLTYVPRRAECREALRSQTADCLLDGHLRYLETARPVPPSQAVRPAQTRPVMMALRRYS